MRRPVIAAALLVSAAGCVGAPQDDRPAAVKAAANAQPGVASAPSASDVERAAYLSKIQLSKIESRHGKNSLTGSPQAIVDGEIKNTGDRTVGEVEVTIYFLDKSGKALHEDTYHPVLPEGSFGTGQPLKPNYSRHWGGGFDVPSEWDGKVEVKVTDVKFAAEPAK